MSNFDNTCPGAAPHEPPKEEEVVEEKKEDPIDAHDGITLEQDILDEIKTLFFAPDYERFL